MKKFVLPFLATFTLASGSLFSYQDTASAASIKTDEEWITIENSTESSGSILQTATESPYTVMASKPDYKTNWNLKKRRQGLDFFACNYAMLTKASAKMRINTIEAKSRLYYNNGALSKSKTDTNSNSNYAGAEAVGTVTGGYGCKGKAYGNSKYVRKKYKTVTHQKKWNIKDVL